ncbi:MAG: YcjF family protein [Desulfobaccales bacterium]
MSEKFLGLVLYPALADGLSKDEQEALKGIVEGMEGVESAQVIDAISQRISALEMSRLASMVPNDQKYHYYSQAKQIATVGGLSQPEKIALQELATALKIACDREVFDIPEHDVDVNLKNDEQNFYGIAKKFSMIAGAIGFLPTPFISDFTLISPLQLYMVDKIANLYNYPLNPKELLKMTSGTVGLGYACLVVARGLLAFVPVGGWFVAGGIAFSGTFAIAIIAQKYIENKGDLSEESVKRIYKEAFEEGKKQFKLLKNDIAKEKDNLLGELKKFLKEKSRIKNG